MVGIDAEGVDVAYGGAVGGGVEVTNGVTTGAAEAEGSPTAKCVVA